MDVIHYHQLCSVCVVHTAVPVTRNLKLASHKRFLQQDRSVSYAFVCPFDFVSDYCLGSVDLVRSYAKKESIKACIKACIALTCFSGE